MIQILLLSCSPHVLTKNKPIRLFCRKKRHNKKTIKTDWFEIHENAVVRSSLLVICTKKLKDMVEES
jgi:hypothetical protein